MANGLNRATLVGNLGRDPELKFTQGGQAVLRLSLATSESFLGKDGQRQERTDWHNVVVWGKRAEALNKILAKGRTVWVEGRIQTRSWEDQQGQKRYTTEINAIDVGIVGSGHGAKANQQREDGFDGAGDDHGDDDDIPF